MEHLAHNWLLIIWDNHNLPSTHLKSYNNLQNRKCANLLTRLYLGSKFSGDLIFTFYIFLIFYQKFVLKNPKLYFKEENNIPPVHLPFFCGCIIEIERLKYFFRECSKRSRI